MVTVARRGSGAFIDSQVTGRWAIAEALWLMAVATVLFLLGVGWSVALIAGSALLTESVPEAERVSAQGLSDVMMSLLGATAAFSSGFAKAAVGYDWLANFATAAAVLVLIGAIRLNAQLAITRVG